MSLSLSLSHCRFPVVRCNRMSNSAFAVVCHKVPHVKVTATPLGCSARRSPAFRSCSSVVTLLGRVRVSWLHAALASKVCEQVGRAYKQLWIHRPHPTPRVVASSRVHRLVLVLVRRGCKRLDDHQSTGLQSCDASTVQAAARHWRQRAEDGDDCARHPHASSADVAAGRSTS